jgi:hypothetical protein
VRKEGKETYQSPSLPAQKQVEEYPQLQSPALPAQLQISALLQKQFPEINVSLIYLARRERVD